MRVESGHARLQKTVTQWRMQDFLKEGSVTIAYTKFLKPRLFLIVLERNFLSYLSIDPFLIEISAKACKGEPQKQFS